LSEVIDNAIDRPCWAVEQMAWEEVYYHRDIGKNPRNKLAALYLLREKILPLSPFFISPHGRNF